MHKCEIKIFFFGDSICFGQGVSIYLGWIPRLAEKVATYWKAKGVNILITNTSINGNTTRLALERMPYDIQNAQPDILITQFGMNDCNYWETDKENPRVSKDAFVANLKEIIARGKTFGVKKILLNTNHISGRTLHTMADTDITYQQSNKEYNELIRQVVCQSDPNLVSFVDIENHFKEHFLKTKTQPKDFLLEDLLHINEQGHDFYLKIYYPILMQVIEDIIKRRQDEDYE